MASKKRRTQAELCDSYKKQRRVLYYERAKIIKSQTKQKLTDKQIEKGNKRIKSLNSRIDKLSVKMFKCGKRYAKFRKERMSLIKKVSRLKVELKTNRDISSSQRNRILAEITAINADIRNLTSLMGKDIVEQQKGILAFVSDVSLGQTYEMVVLWEVKRKIDGLLQYGTFKYLSVQGEVYSLDINFDSALWAVDDYLADIAASQRDSTIKTPMVKLSTDESTETITIE